MGKGSIGWLVSAGVSGQRLDPHGNEIRTNDFRISHMGPDTDPEPWNWSASEPAVAFSPRLGEHPVVWQGYFMVAPFVNDWEIFGQRLMQDKLRSFIAERSPVFLARIRTTMRTNAG